MDPGRETRVRGNTPSSRSNLREISASLLEAAGPLTLLGAQVIYLLEPFFPARRDEMHALARRLEHPDGNAR
jgi:hypothetical protein